MKLTEEQQAVVDTVLSDSSNNIIAVNSIAGSGKTATATAIINAVNPTNGLYTAFNKAIIESGKSKFGDKIQCNTLHSLAYNYTRPRYGVKDLTYDSIKEKISYEKKQNIIKLINEFCCSSYTDFYDYADDHNYSQDDTDIAFYYLDNMINGVIQPTFNFLLKNLHLQLLNNYITINKDMIIIDEAQDVTGVTLEIFKLINSPKKVILGDKFQNIYSFMNTVNAFEELSNTIELKLTQSFRCSKDIADIIERYGNRFLEEDFKYKGLDNVNSTNDIVYLSRTNSALVQRMYELVLEDKEFKLIRNIHELFALPLAIKTIRNGRYNSDYAYLSKEYNFYTKMLIRECITEKEYKFCKYLEDIMDDVNINAACKVVNYFDNRNINIFDFYEHCKHRSTRNANITLSTVHAYKGLEANTVYIEEDLNTCLANILSRHRFKSPNDRDNITRDDKENLNLYYVALSRAKNRIVGNTF